MELTRTSPVQFNIKPISGSTLNLKFIVKGSRDIIRFDIRVIIHSKNPVHRTMTDMISSDILGLYTLIEDRSYKVLIKIPEFKNYTKSYIIFTIDPNESLYKKVFVNDINIEFSSQKIDGPVIEEISSPNGHTKSDTMFQMVSQYNELPKDSKKRISYIYSLYANDSFAIVASNHVKYLKYKYMAENEHIEIESIDWSQLGGISWNEKRNVLLHPFLYPFASIGSFAQNSRNFAKLLGMKNKIGGFDVADSNRISSFAVGIVNRIDLMIVPSGFARDAYISSGVTTPVEILPHGIPDEFLSDGPVSINNSDIIKLRKTKESGNILILYFLIHSEHRKGADLVRNVMKRIQKKFGNVYLVVKGPNCSYFSGVKTIHITSWVSNDDLVALYDACDVCICPSRGGGFELNALEAVSRCIPTLVSGKGCFLDLINYFIPISISNIATQSLPGNAVHIGYGCEPDIDDFEAKLTDVIDRIDHWKNRYKEISKEVKDIYTWKVAANKLDNILRNYEFIA